MKLVTHALGAAVITSACLSAAAQAQCCAGMYGAYGANLMLTQSVVVPGTLTTRAIRDKGFRYPYMNVAPGMVSLIKPRVGPQLSDSPVF